MSRNDRTKQALYRLACGDPFNCLPDVLRAFHSLPSGGQARGELTITRGPGRIRGKCADLMRLPPAGEGVAVRLEVQVHAERERWIRDFGAHRLVTEQWCRSGLLVEAAGPMWFGFRLTADETRMEFAMERCWLLGLPVPLFLAPRVDAVVTGRASGWWTVVNVRVPLLGLLARYEGEMRPLC